MSPKLKSELVEWGVAAVFFFAAGTMVVLGLPPLFEASPGAAVFLIAALSIIGASHVLHALFQGVVALTRPLFRQKSAPDAAPMMGGDGK